MVSGDKFNGSNAFINLYPVFLSGSIAGLIQFELELHQKSIEVVRAFTRASRVLDILSVVLPAWTLILDNPHFRVLRIYTGHNYEHDGVLLGLGIISNIHAKTPLLSKVYDTPLLKFYGRISFGVYLLHQPCMALTTAIWRIPEKLIASLEEHDNKNIVLDFAIILVLLTTLMAYVSAKFYEEPMNRLIKRIDMNRIIRISGIALSGAATALWIKDKETELPLKMHHEEV
jgi:peptidoglycan/LPS O-acetylase OafA/YrhL